MRVFVGVAVASVLMVTSVACTTASVDGTPSPAPTAAGATSQSPVAGSGFDPCRDISDASLTSFGLDPSTRKVSAVQEAELGAGCGWKNQQVTLDFFVTPQTVDGLASNQGFLNIKKISVDDRSSVQFQIDEQRSCVVGISSQASTIIVNLSVNFSSIGSVDPCATALDIATKLAPTLPK